MSPRIGPWPSVPLRIHSLWDPLHNLSTQPLESCPLDSSHPLFVSPPPTCVPPRISPSLSAIPSHESLFVSYSTESLVSFLLMGQAADPLVAVLPHRSPADTLVSVPPYRSLCGSPHQTLFICLSADSRVSDLLYLPPVDRLVSALTHKSLFCCSPCIRPPLFAFPPADPVVSVPPLSIDVYAFEAPLLIPSPQPLFISYSAYSLLSVLVHRSFCGSSRYETFFIGLFGDLLVSFLLHFPPVNSLVSVPL